MMIKCYKKIIANNKVSKGSFNGPFRKDLDNYVKKKMSFSSMRFGQFCDFLPKVCYSTSGSKRYVILPFSSSSLTPSIFLH
ncbi:hypothetical protein Hanom_Chr06g00538921 [Helianthus anomalus]